MNEHALRFFLPAALATTLGCTLCPPEAHAADTADTLLQAVNFILTGKDIADIRLVDRAGCVFERTSTYNGQTLLTERYYLNNVDLSRVTLQELHNGLGQRWIQANIRGQAAVYEYTNQSGTHQASDWAGPLQTAELDRVKRAWRYIYTHGCRSTASAY